MGQVFYIIAVFVAAILGWVSWFVVLSKLSPFLSGDLALAFFYSSLFLALTGTFTVVIYYLRLALNKSENFFRHLNAALRQGALLSFMVCVGLAFQRLRVLTWWDALLLLMIVLLIEYYFMNRE
jgi:hypothetical protein